MPARARPGSRHTGPASGRAARTPPPTAGTSAPKTGRDARRPGSIQSRRSSAATTVSCSGSGRPRSGVPGRHRSMSRAVASPKSCAARSRTAPFPAQARSPSASRAASACGQPILSTSRPPEPSRAGAPRASASRAGATQAVWPPGLERLADRERPHLDRLPQGGRQRRRQPVAPPLRLGRRHQIPRQHQPSHPAHLPHAPTGLPARDRAFHDHVNKGPPWRLSSYSSGLRVKPRSHRGRPRALSWPGVKRHRCFIGAAMTAPVLHRCRYCRAGRGGSGFAGRAGGTHGTRGKTWRAFLGPGDIGTAWPGSVVRQPLRAPVS